MTLQGVFRANLRVVSKETALEFYKGIRSVILIPYDKGQKIRVEPGQHISVVPDDTVKNGSAIFIPSFHDEDGTLAYYYRKYINRYLEKE